MIAHKGAGAKALAATTLDFIVDPALAHAAKTSFAEEIENVVYQPIIPAEQIPPTHLNYASMERYRPAIATFYPTDPAHFA